MTDNNNNRHMAFICSKGDLDMVYPALIMGWAALGVGIDVSIFFTFWGLDMVTKSKVDKTAKSKKSIDSTNPCASCSALKTKNKK